MDLPFAGFLSGHDEAALFITRNNPWAEKRVSDEPFCLVEAAKHIAYSYNESCEADSADSQEEYFWRTANVSITSILGGALARAELELRHALNYDVAKALNLAELTEVRLFKDERGHWTFDLNARSRTA